MKAEMKQQTTQFVYLIDSRLGLARVGVAPDPRKRLRELQVGSPVRLELVLVSPYRRREDARAVAAELARRFAARRAHGQWYRVTRAEVERALASGQLRAAPARAARAHGRQRSVPTSAGAGASGLPSRSGRRGCSLAGRAR